MQENETKKFDKNAYDIAYHKEKYKQMKLDIKPEIFDLITKHCEDAQISRTKFLVNCAMYIIDNDLTDKIM